MLPSPICRHRLIVLPCLHLLLFLWGVNAARALPSLITYQFSVEESKLIPGSSDSCSAAPIAGADQIGMLALVAGPHTDGNCYNRSAYADSDFLVERGIVSAGSGGASYPAYRVHEAQQKATEWVASRHSIYYRFPTVEDYTVYAFNAGVVEKIAEVAAAEITPNQFVSVTVANPLYVNGIAGNATYVIAPSSARISPFTELASGVEGASTATNAIGEISKYRYQVDGTPFDTAAGYTAGPGRWNNRYGDKRRFFLFHGSAQGSGAVWQDQDDSSIFVTRFGTDLISPATVSLANPGGQQLAAAAGDAGGYVYFLTIQTGSDDDPTVPRAAKLSKAGLDGAVIASVDLDTSRSGLNLYAFSDFANSAVMHHSAGKLGVILGRTMLQGGDGLNHQGAIGLVFDDTTLVLERNWGQTSGHSFEGCLSSNSLGEFVGIDLGDNYPRGVHLHKFDESIKRSQVVSSFKTSHGTTANSPAGATYPEYTEISSGNTTYYRWSNDNNTYTELGGVEETALGYAVSFIGEPSPGGLLMDNGRVGDYLNDPRNVALVTVVEDFQTIADLESMVVTQGAVETGGFYTFGGSWSQLKNAGVVWLTAYANLDQNASRLKMLSLADGNLLLIWEIWTAQSYGTTRAMVVDPHGTTIVPETDLGIAVRLDRRSDPIIMGDQVYLMEGHPASGLVELTVIDLGETAAAAFAITSVARTASGVSINWPATGAETYIVEYSRSLRSWSEIATVPAGASAPSFTDDESTRINQPVGFYRVREGG